jgi:two-component system, NarL family, sensor kinase
LRAAGVFLLLFFFSHSASLAGQDTLTSIRKRRIDSIEQLLAKHPSDSARALLLNYRASDEFLLDDELGYRTALEAKSLADKIHFSNGIFRSAMTLGSIEEYRKNYEYAVHWYLFADSVAAATGSYAGSVESGSSLLNLYFYSGDYIHAMELCTARLEFANEKQDSSAIANYTNLLGFIHRQLGNPEESEKYYREFLRLAMISGDSAALAAACTEMAEILTAAHKFDSALTFLSKAFGLYAQKPARHKKAYVCYKIAQTYQESGDLANADKYSRLAIDYTLTVPSNQYDIAAYYVLRADILQRQEKFPESIMTLDSAYTISALIRHRETLRDEYRLYAAGYAALGENAKAYSFLSRYTALKDSLVNEQNLRQVAAMNVRYRLAEKQQELNLFRSKTELAAADEKRKNIFRNAVIVTAVLFLLSAFLFFTRAQLKQKNELNLRINAQQNELFQKITNAQEKERKRIAGDLHDGLGSVLSAIKIQVSLLRSEVPPEKPALQERLLKTESMIDAASVELRNVSHRVMPAALAKLGISAALESLVRGITSEKGIHFSFSSSGITRRPVEAVELGAYHVALELINNVIRHSQASRAEVKLEEAPGMLRLQVTDNGSGFDQHAAKDGLGLASIQNRVAFLKGKFTITSAMNEGTEIEIQIPL